MGKMKRFLTWVPVLTILCLLSLNISQSGCRVKNPTLKVEKYSRAIRVACVGDSITWGSGIEDREQNSYPATMSRILGNKFNVRNFGVPGATQLKRGDHPYWETEAFQQAQDFNPDVVIIKLGTNDSKPQNWRYKNEFMGDLKAMIAKFRYLPGKPQVWLCTPCPVYGDGQWGITPRIVENEIIPTIRQVAEDGRIPLIDIYSALNHHAEFFPDLVHPNAEGAEHMARTIAGALTGI
ncbi:MAG: GDSL-type esterase/lipase family protein [Limisphaerales bacterium]|jgi:acyl-CoA thioesterase-1